jgi:hypothetical protein
MNPDDEEIAAANRRGAAIKAANPAVVEVQYDAARARIVLILESGVEVSFEPAHAQGFQHARPDQLDVAEISPSGLGVHFPKIDADIYLPGLLDGLLGSRRWMASHNGKLGGVSTSPAKRAAARNNGKLGGRPRSKPDASA